MRLDLESTYTCIIYPKFQTLFTPTPARDHGAGWVRVWGENLADLVH